MGLTQIFNAGRQSMTFIGIDFINGEASSGSGQLACDIYSTVILCVNNPLSVMTCRRLNTDVCIIVMVTWWSHVLLIMMHVSWLLSLLVKHSRLWRGWAHFFELLLHQQHCEARRCRSITSLISSLNMSLHDFFILHSHSTYVQQHHTC